MADIFISYKREDADDANAVASHLTKAGYSCWFDESLVAGQRWDEAIRQELRQAKCVVVIWSKSSWTSKFVQAEAMEGFERNVLVAARVDDVRLEAPFNVVQTADLQHSRGLESLTLGVEALIPPTAKDSPETRRRALEDSWRQFMRGQEEERRALEERIALECILSDLAAKRRTATYSEIADALVTENDVALWRMLNNAIVERDGQAVVLGALVVSEATGLPDNPFFAKFLPHVTPSKRPEAWSEMVADIFELMSED